VFIDKSTEPLYTEIDYPLLALLCTLLDRFFNNTTTTIDYRFLIDYLMLPLLLGVPKG